MSLPSINLVWLDYPASIVHGASLLLVAFAVGYMIRRDRNLVPRAIKATQWWFVIYVVWLATFILVGPAVGVEARALLRIVGAPVAVMFAVAVVRHVRQMRVILRRAD